MKKYVIALIAILTFLTLKTFSFAKPALQNYSVAVAEAAEITPELSRGAGGIPESASLLLFGAGMLFIAIYIRKRWMGKEE
ncbi:MAG: PEP-CTERM sorting domain-containing protein [Nitrospirota bacterium]